MRELGPRRLVPTLLMLVVAVGCASGQDGGSSDPEPPPTPELTDAALADSLRELGASQVDDILSGSSPPPSLIDWESVAEGSALSPPLESSFCNSLNGPGVDNALAG